jgi:hypothetical protein
VGSIVTVYVLVQAFNHLINWVIAVAPVLITVAVMASLIELMMHTPAAE